MELSKKKFKKNRLVPVNFFLITSIGILGGCSGLEQSEQAKIRKANAKAEEIVCRSNDLYPTLQIPERKSRIPYPWEHEGGPGLPKITKEYFRCKGNSRHPPKLTGSLNGGSWIHDCGGSDRHGLPLRDGKEFIYPVLLDLLNYIQKKSGHKVIITAGHRCYAHELYVRSLSPGVSKHLLGAQVSFYVEQMELNPEEIARIIKNFYLEYYPSSKELMLSSKAIGGRKSWSNQEIALTIVPKDEGRDFDNRHPYPYLVLELLYDKNKQQKIHINLQQALSNYYRD